MPLKYNIQQDIRRKIDKRLEQLPFKLRKWAKLHLIEPKKIVFYIHLKEKRKGDAWLVTDHVGIQDSSYRIIYDENIGKFGLIVDLKDGTTYCLGFYGDFDKTVESM